MDMTTALAIALGVIAAPFIRYLFLLPGRLLYRFLWKRLPDGRLRSLLLKKRPTPGGEEAWPTWPRLPPGP